MEAKVEVLAFHGWGYDNLFWEPLRKLISPEIDFKAASRGYYSHPKTVHFEGESSRKVIFAHSYGLHWIDKTTLKQADILFMFASFHKFLPDKPDQKKYVLKVLDAMIQKIDHAPYSLMNEFWMRSQRPASIEMDKVIRDVSLLRSDLEHLYHTHLEIPDFQHKKIIMLEAEKDEIFVNSHMKEFHNHFHTKIYYKMMENVGHAFPFTNPEETYSIIKKAMPIFGHHE